MRAVSNLWKMAKDTVVEGVFGKSQLLACFCSPSASYFSPATPLGAMRLADR